MEKINNSFEKIYEKVPGGIFGLIHIVITFLITNIASSLTPGFNMNDNYISDLGASPGLAGLIFNVGMIIAGIILLLYYMIPSACLAPCLISSKYFIIRA